MYNVLYTYTPWCLYTYEYIIIAMARLIVANVFVL